MLSRCHWHQPSTFTASSSCDSICSSLRRLVLMVKFLLSSEISDICRHRGRESPCLRSFEHGKHPTSANKRTATLRRKFSRLTESENFLSFFIFYKSFSPVQPTNQNEIIQQQHTKKKDQISIVADFFFGNFKISLGLETISFSISWIITFFIRNRDDIQLRTSTQVQWSLWVVRSLLLATWRWRKHRKKRSKNWTFLLCKIK